MIAEHFITDGQKTVVVGYGKAQCSPEDEFDTNTGVRCAILRDCVTPIAPENLPSDGMVFYGCVWHNSAQVVLFATIILLVVSIRRILRKPDHLWQLIEFFEKHVTISYMEKKRCDAPILEVVLQH